MGSITSGVHTGTEPPVRSGAKPPIPYCSDKKFSVWQLAISEEDTSPLYPFSTTLNWCNLRTPVPNWAHAPPPPKKKYIYIFGKQKLNLDGILLAFNSNYQWVTVTEAGLWTCLSVLPRSALFPPPVYCMGLVPIHPLVLLAARYKITVRQLVRTNLHENAIRTKWALVFNCLF